MLDLGGPRVVESLEITSGPTGGPFYLSEVNVGPTPDTLSRDLLHHSVRVGIDAAMLRNEIESRSMRYFVAHSFL